MTNFRSYKMCLTLGNNLCSEAFSFDSVRKEYSQAEDNDYQNYNIDIEDFDYKERITTFKEDDYIELNLKNIEIFTKINDRNREITKMVSTTPNYYKNLNQKLKAASEKDKVGAEDIVKSSNIGQESKDVSQSVKRDKIMLILGRVVEFCLLFLIIITTILCVFLLCAIKFC